MVGLLLLCWASLLTALIQSLGIFHIHVAACELSRCLLWMLVINFGPTDMALVSPDLQLPGPCKFLLSAVECSPLSWASLRPSTTFYLVQEGVSGSPVLL